MKKRMIISVILGLVCLSIVYVFLLSRKTFPISYGISFNQNHALSLGLDWKKTYLAMLDELHPKYIRIAAMWSEVEKERDVYDFADVDWMMDQAAAYKTKVVLVVGQKSPRWPECHVPDWLGQYDTQQSREYLLAYIEQTVKRYTQHDALEIWQVENEPFINFKFGDCANYDSDMVANEIAFVKGLDPDRKILVTDSGELSTWRKSTRAGDLFGTTLYRVVRTPGGMIWRYDWLPAAFYQLKARVWGRNYETFFVAELQAEPWFVDAGAERTPVAEQEKTMNPDRLKKHIEFVRHVGASRAYLWGVEWWYFMKEKHNDPRYWDIVKEVMAQSQ